MIFSDHDILQALKDKRIGIDPFDPQALQPASVDLRLGNVFYRFNDVLPRPILNIRESVRQHMIRFEAHGSLVLHPQEFLLGCTQEKISLGNNVVARIEGKSSIGRLGITIHSTAGFIDPGNRDLNITLEIVNHSPMSIRLCVGMHIAQISFHSLLSPCDKPYGPESRYYGNDEPVPSRVDEKL